MRIFIFLLLALNLNAQMVRFGGNISGITSTQLATDTFRLRANFNDITGVSNGTQLQAGDIFWNPPLNSGDTCRRMVVISADTLFTSFVVFTVNTLGQGNPSTQNSKVMRETPNQSLDYIPQGGDQALRECISQYYSNILDQLIGTGGGGGLSSVLVDSITIFGDGLNTPLYIDTTYFFTQGAFKDSLGDGQFQQNFIADGVTAVYQVDSILPTEKRSVFVYWNGQGIDEAFITNYQPALGSLELSFIPDQGDRIVVKWFDGNAFIETFGGLGGVDSVFTDGITALGTGLLTDKIRVDTSVIATQSDIANFLEIVTTDMFLVGDGTPINPLGIDTMYVASKAYVDQSIAGSGLGDITGVNETPQYGIIGGSASGAVLLSVDSSVIAAKTWVTAQLPTVNNATLTLAVSGSGLSGSQTFTANQETNATFTVTSNATNANTPSTIVFRDGSGNFSAGTITGTLNGTANQVANTLTRGNFLTGNNFNGSAATTFAVDTTTIAHKNYVSAVIAPKLDSVFVDMFLFGNGTQSNPLSIDTMYVASKEYVDNSIAGAGAGDITGVNEFGGYGLLGGAASGAVTLTVDTSVIASKTWSTDQLPTVNNATLTMAVSGNGLSGSQTFTANQGTNATFTVTSNGTSNNTGNTLVYRDASGNFSAGTITATTFSGTASQVANTLTRGTYLTGSNYNGSAATTWAVDATTTNTASKVVARDGSGNFSAGTITANLSGTATQVSQTLTRGAFLTGGDYTGATARTWAVDTTTIAAKSWVTAQLGGSNVTATNGASNKLAFFTSGTNIDGNSDWRLGNQIPPVLTNSTDVFYYGNGNLTDRFSVFGKTYLEDATVGTLAATTFNATNFGVTNLTVTNSATFNGTVANSVFNPGGQLGIQTTPTTDNNSLTTRTGAYFNVTQNSLASGNVRMSSASQQNMFLLNSGLNSIGIGGGAPNSSFNLVVQKGVWINAGQTGGLYDGLLVSGLGATNLLNVSASNASVGINTGTPSSTYKLDVNGTTRIYNNGIVLQNATTGTASTDGTYISNSSNDLVINNREAGGLNLYTNNNGLGNNIYINSIGDVGVGRVDQTSKFDVNGDIKTNGFFINNAAASLGGIDFYNTITGSGGSDGMTVRSSSLNLLLTNRENGEVFIRTDNNEFKGIKLKNTGVVQFTGYVLGTLSTDASGNISASDGRLKTITNKLDSGLDKVLKLNPVYYKWNKDSGFNTEFTELGFIAQDVKKVIPEAVPNEETETNRLNYSDRAIIATLVKAMQEQQEQIEELKKEVERLKSKID
jgi:hypothetical protein